MFQLIDNMEANKYVYFLSIALIGIFYLGFSLIFMNVVIQSSVTLYGVEYIKAFFNIQYIIFITSLHFKYKLYTNSIQYQFQKL